MIWPVAAGLGQLCWRFRHPKLSSVGLWPPWAVAAASNHICTGECLSLEPLCLSNSSTCFFLIGPGFRCGRNVSDNDRAFQSTNKLRESETPVFVLHFVSFPPFQQPVGRSALLSMPMTCPQYAHGRFPFYFKFPDRVGIGMLPANRPAPERLRAIATNNQSDSLHSYLIHPPLGCGAKGACPEIYFVPRVENCLSPREDSQGGDEGKQI